MVLHDLFFYILAAIILGGGILTITRRNAVHSAIFLVVTLIGVAGLFLHLRAEFLAAVQVFLYIGGITVLFLFVIMLVNLDEAARHRQFNRQWGLALGCVLLLVAELGYFLYQGKDFFSFSFAETSGVLSQNNTQEIAMSLYRDYLLPFEIASLLLLVAIVGAVVMAKKQI